MNKLMKLGLLIFSLLMCFNCSDIDAKFIEDDGRHDILIKESIINPAYIGNGVQWGGYEIVEGWTGNATLSDEDWTKLFKRVEFMSPQIMRLMISAGSTYLTNGEFTPTKDQNLFKILDFCQEKGIQVIFGEWGHSGKESIDEQWLDYAVKFTEYLVNEKKYTCIKYYNMVNEPNGDWSSINGNYDLWKSLIQKLYAKFEASGLSQKLELIGPDVAIWDTDLTWWVSNTYNDMDAMIGAYDIHTYPSETIMRNGAYQQMIAAYKKSASPVKPIFMGELGFKYDSKSALGIENLKRISNDKYASGDSNMFIYDSFYGVDIADGIMQNMLAGYSGVVLWNMDDAMYNNPSDGYEKLKRWGFWNILGSEKFENPNDENIRPWFYTVSLLCRYFPEGSRLFEVQLPNKVGVRAIAAEKDGKYTIAIVNSHLGDYDIYLKMENGIQLQNMNVYTYKAGEGSSFEGKVDSNNFAVPAQENVTYDFSNDKSYKLKLDKQSFVLITNM